MVVSLMFNTKTRTIQISKSPELFCQMLVVITELDRSHTQVPLVDLICTQILLSVSIFVYYSLPLEHPSHQYSDPGSCISETPRYLLQIMHAHFCLRSLLCMQPCVILFIATLFLCI